MNRSKYTRNCKRIRGRKAWSESNRSRCYHQGDWASRKASHETLNSVLGKGHRGASTKSTAEVLESMPQGVPKCLIWLKMHHPRIILGTKFPFFVIYYKRICTEYSLKTNNAPVLMFTTKVKHTAHLTI